MSVNENAPNPWIDDRRSSIHSFTGPAFPGGDRRARFRAGAGFEFVLRRTGDAWRCFGFFFFVAISVFARRNVGYGRCAA
jgi:hypothetical protein